MAVADHSAQAWMQGFNDAGVAVFGMSANELIEIKVCVLQVPVIQLLTTSHRTAMSRNITAFCTRLTATLSTFPVVPSKTRTTLVDPLCLVMKLIYSLQDQTRVRYGITRIAPLDYKEEAQALNEMLSSEWAR